MTTATTDRTGVRRAAPNDFADLRGMLLTTAALRGMLLVAAAAFADFDLDYGGPRRRVDSPAVADVDLDEGGPWRHIDSAVAELITAVNRLTAAKTGESPRTAASNVPPVVRARELAVAQRRLLGVLDRPIVDDDLVELVVGSVRRLGLLLRA